MNEDLRSLASDIVDKARALGADEADAYVRTGTESSVTVRMGETEKLIEAGSVVFPRVTFTCQMPSAFTAASPERSQADRSKASS